ncbi:MAG: beta-galactosidase [Burkholderiales bacterium PBB6]|nr:MAG: beta-galactosidase [Burkholderiales bacterium PBB6]
MRLGVCYYPEQWPREQWASDARRMRELGIRLVRIAEFAWARMEPSPGQFEWAWLDDAIATLAAEGLKVVLGTPTAAPPAWLVQRHPDVLPVDAHGRTKAFGSRRHYCFSSEAFHAASERIVTAMAQRYGQHPAVVAWQTDNEYGCHDTVLSYSPAALAGFRRWLAQRYGSIHTLNAAWGTAFWSLQANSFDDIGFPVGQPTGALPTHALDFRRFASDEVLRYNRMQVRVLREHAPGRDVLHNFMGMFGEFDHHAMGADLDVAAWDNYPLGFTDTAPFISEADRLSWARTGHPDISAFHHDLYRGICKGRWWVMEQQAGPVNWAHWNAMPLPGMVRTWTWEAFAHGAEVVSYFRWRQLPYAQEQMHSGLHTPDDVRDLGGEEAAQVARELAALPDDAVLADATTTTTAPVALVFDYSAKWMTDIVPQGADMSYFGQVFGAYSALRQLGLDVDIVGPDAPLDVYRMVVVTGLTHLTPALSARLQALSAVVVLGPRTGSKTEHLGLSSQRAGAAPLGLAMHLPITAVDSMRPGLQQPVVGVSGDELGQPLGHGHQWRDLAQLHADSAARVLARYEDGYPAWVQQGRWFRQCGMVDAPLQARWFTEAARLADLPVVNLPAGLRLRRRGDWLFAVHRGPGHVQVPAPAGTSFVLGDARIGPAQVAMWHAPLSAAGAVSRTAANLVANTAEEASA